jgi:hypothetical protein
MRLYLPILLLSFSLAACDGLEPEGDASQVFVESYQVANEPLQPVRLTRTSPVDGRYDPTARAVREAGVVIERLREDGSVEATHPYREAQAGVYVAVDPDATVLPFQRYRLRAETTAGEIVTATTFVPHGLELVSASADTVVYQEDGASAFRVRRGPYPGRQNVYIISTEALVPSVETLTPFYRNILEDEEGNIDPDDLTDNRVNESFPNNEAIYEVDGDVVTVPLLWFGVAFYGPTRIAINALDDNLYNFVRSVRVQHEGGLGNSPGEIGSLLEYVEGGTGVFGSYAKAERMVYIAR